jgi:DUF4097 and DUF4098 domain-containing protein YvlB
MEVMSNGLKWALFAGCLLAVAAFAADDRKECRYSVGPGASVTVTNESGPVEVKGSAARQVVIAATRHSDKVEVQCDQSGSRVQATTRFLRHSDGADAKVEYEVTVPADASVTVRAPGGPITAEKLHGDVILEGDAASVEVRQISNAHVHVSTISGPIKLSNIANGHVEVTSLNGNVQLEAVTGPRVSVNTAKGSIGYTGDFAGGGEYMLVNHSGNIDVVLPASASVDLSARSITGGVENDFPLKQKSEVGFIASQGGRSFAGTSNTGASSVQLRSFSGKIRVKKLSH